MHTIINYFTWMACTLHMCVRKYNKHITGSFKKRAEHVQFCAKANKNVYCVKALPVHDTILYCVHKYN